ncbi:hypothetical protein D3C81_2024350 [compost metagenome]
MGRTLDGFDKQALIALLINRTDVATVDLQVRQTQPLQVADQAEAATEMLQAQGEPELSQAPRQLFETGLLRQLLFANFQGQSRPQIGVRTQRVEERSQRLRMLQGGRRQV